MKILIGNILSYKSNPFFNSFESAIDYRKRGAVLIDGNLIKEVGDRKSLIKIYPNAEIHDYGKKLISAGFIDAHMHYPQTSIIASYGKRLLDWLNNYTFPEENRFNDYEYAKRIASFTLDLCLRNGTTSVASFCTSHAQSADIFFSEAEKRKMRVIAGKTCMDRNALSSLIDTPQSAYDESEKLIKKWHQRSRSLYAISPRFAPTSSPEQLQALGDLWSRYPSCLMQTHISEQLEEIDWVKNLFPNSKDYLDVYDKFNLVREGSIFGHAIHLTDRERKRLLEAKSSLIHCPTSNTFIGSGLFDLKGLNEQKNKIGLGTDTGGGSSFSMFRTMAATYEIAQLKGFSVHPSQLYWLATVGSSISLGIEDKVGNIRKGLEADLVVVNLSSTPVIQNRVNEAKDNWEEIFPTIMLGDDRAIETVWVSGKEIKRRSI